MQRRHRLIVSAYGLGLHWTSLAFIDIAAEEWYLLTSI